MHAAERIPVDASRTARREPPHRQHDTDRSHHDPVPLERVALAGITSGGTALPPDVRADMEARLGGDFSAVRVHTGDAAWRSADALSAEAYTVGDDIVFARGGYAPHDPLGRLRLAHELSHGACSSAPAHRAAARATRPTRWRLPPRPPRGRRSTATVRPACLTVPPPRARRRAVPPPRTRRRAGQSCSGARCSTCPRRANTRPTWRRTARGWARPPPA